MKTYKIFVPPIEVVAENMEEAEKIFREGSGLNRQEDIISIIELQNHE